MDGKAVKLIHFLEGHDKRFIIPVYQRNYSWKEENCRQLYWKLPAVISPIRSCIFYGMKSDCAGIWNGEKRNYGKRRLILCWRKLPR